VSEEKKANLTSGRPLKAASEIQPIRLVPSSSDYATFVKTTIDAMGLTGERASKSKPSVRMLSLLNSES